MPVTSPALVMLAFVGSLLVQVPPTAGVQLMVSPTQTDVRPDKIGNGLTVSVLKMVLVCVQVGKTTCNLYSPASEGVALVNVSVLVVAPEIEPPLIRTIPPGYFFH